MRQIREAITAGELKRVKTLMEKKKLALCHDLLGTSPLHTAVLVS